MRAVPGTVDVSGRAWISPNAEAQATLIDWAFQHGTPGRKLLLETERGAVSGQRGEGTEHVSDNAHFEGDMLVAQSTDKIEGQLVHAERRYVVDASGVVHVAMLVCTGQGEWLSSCEAAQQTLSPGVDAVAIPDDADRGLTPYQLGRITGMICGAGVLAWLVWRFARSQR
ncbi:MAG: hypothetical protein HOV81_11540 [Kofleriaceae bacterium]|nr:hypothetical protein [Kofleriaceae bacterium]